VDTRKWLMSKLKPGKYGDHVEIQHSGEVEHRHSISDREKVRRLAYFLLEDQAAGQIIDGEAEPASDSE